MSDTVPDTSTQQRILITLTDEGGRRATSTITIEQSVTTEAPQIMLSHAAVPELAGGGSLVGLLTARKAGLGDAFTYKLLNDADGRFVIAGDRLLVAKGARLDYEQQSAHKVVVRAVGSDGSILDQAFDITVQDVRDEVILVLTGTATGSNGNDTLIGGRGRDKLSGGLGVDVLFGKQGHDTLTGGSGQDVFILDTKPHARTNVDRIKDFNVKDDVIYLDNGFFKKLGAKGSLEHPAKLSSKMFWKGAKAHDRNDHVLYDPKSGVLAYDPDGTGHAAAVRFALVSKNLASLSHKDFLVI